MNICCLVGSVSLGKGQAKRLQQVRNRGIRFKKNLLEYIDIFVNEKTILEIMICVFFQVRAL